MPLSREHIDNLLKSCDNSQEKLLVLLIRDLEGRPVALESVNLSDFNRVSGFLRLTQGEGKAPEVVKLSQETMRAFHEYTFRRKDQNEALFVNGEGQRLTGSELRETAGRIAAKASLGLNFDGLRFQVSRPSQTGRFVAKGASRDLFYLYGIVSHPVRRQIVQLLGNEGGLGFTQIKKRIDVPVGTLYYHFDMLAGLVIQDSQKKYVLTEAGKEAHRKLRSQEYAQSTDLLSEHMPTAQGPMERSLKLLLPNSLLTAIQSKRTLALFGAAVLLGLGSFSVYMTQLETVVLFVNPSDQSPLLLGLGFLVNWVVIYGVADLIATFLFGRKGEHWVLLIGTAYALIPLLVFVGWWDLAVALNLRFAGLSTLGLSRVVLIILQAWSLGLLARAVSGLKGLRLDKAAVISLALAYLSIMIAYVRGV